MKKINILYCIEFLSYGGTEKQLMSLIEGLDKNKFQAHLCCLRKSIISDYRKDSAGNLFKKIKCPKIQLDFVSFRNIRSWLEILRLVRFIRSHRIDVIHTYFQDPAVVGLLAAKLSGVKHVTASFRDMGFWRVQENDTKMKAVYKLCTHYIANSLAVRDLYMKLYDLRDDKFIVIHNGVDVERFASISNKKFHGNKVPVVGIVATLNRKVKRVDVFLKAAKIVCQRIKGVKFIVAGDGELKADLMCLCKDLGISRDVEFLGGVEKISEFLYSIDIGVISSDSEGFSNAILEYMAAGVPVVATDVGGNSECITNGKTGFLVTRGDYSSLAEKIIKLLSEPEIYLQIQGAAYAMVFKEFKLAHCIEKHENFYSKIMKGGGVGS